MTTADPAEVPMNLKTSCSVVWSLEHRTSSALKCRASTKFHVRLTSLLKLVSLAIYMQSAIVFRINPPDRLSVWHTLVVCQNDSSYDHCGLQCRIAQWLKVKCVVKFTVNIQRGHPERGRQMREGWKASSATCMSDALLADSVDTTLASLVVQQLRCSLNCTIS